MKISILPKFNMQANKEELAYTHKPLYEGQNRFAAYILNRIFYILAFAIPFATLLFLMNHFGYAPFGEMNMFIVDGAYVNLPVLTGAIHDLSEGNFHLYTLKGTVGSEFISSIVYYLTSPCTLFCLLFEQKTAVIVLSFLCVLRISLSGPIFMYYLTHRHIGKRGSIYDPMMLVFSLGYALSNFALVQYDDFMYLDHFMLFPLLILFLEELITEGKYKKLLLLNTFLLFSNFYLGLILDIFLLLFYFCKNNQKTDIAVFRFCKLIGIYIASFLLSAITVFPGMAALIDSCYVNYLGIYQQNIHGDFISFFLRHLFYSNPSFMEIGQLGSNLYFGMFLLLLSFLYFFSSRIPFKERCRNGIFLLILVLSLCTMQFSYFFHLMTLSESGYTCYTFVYVFFLLSIGQEILPHIRTTKPWQLILALCAPAAIVLIGINYSKLPPNYNSVYYSLALILCYGILMILYRIGSTKRDSFFSLILCLFCLEMFANAFQLTFQNAKYGGTINDSLVSNAPIQHAEDAFERAVRLDNIEFSYQENLLSSYSFNRLFTKPDFFPTASPMHDSFNNLRYLYADIENKQLLLDEKQYKHVTDTDKYTVYENTSSFPDAYTVSGQLNNEQIDSSTFLTTQNSIAKALGSEGDIYVEDTGISAQISLPEDSTIEAYSLGNNIFAVTNQRVPENGTSTQITIQFTPTQTGELYISLHGTPYYYGPVSAGKDYEYSFTANTTTFFDNCFWLQFFYPDHAALKKLSDKLHSTSCEMYYKNNNSINVKANTDEPSTIVTALPYDAAFYLDQTSSDDITIANFNGRTALYVPEGNHTITISYRHTPFILGVCLSILSFFVCLLCITQKLRLRYVSVAKNMVRGTKKFIHASIAFIRENYVYFLAFLLPFAGYLLTNLILHIEPFGLFSRFDSDGSSIFLPITYEATSLLKNGLSAHSWDAAGGYNTSNVIQLYLCDLVYYFVPESMISLFASFLPLVLISLSGVSMVFYFTHRLLGKRAHKKDYRLLIPVICYTFCNYMILAYNNANWYYAFALLPLILLGMDYLMIKQKKRYYVLCLSLSLLLHYYITMFICFYLVIRFFTYEFHGVADFIKKGIRFALCSIFTGCLSLFTLFFGMSGLSGSTYGTADSVLPSFGFFNGWEYIINRLSVFREGFTISWQDGNVNVYFGILPLILLVVYVLHRNKPWKEKLRFIFPYAIFFLSLNERVLNYIFNGFHYQHGVPNRYAFLITITIAFISYDCIRSVNKIPRKMMLFSAIGLMILFTISFLVSSDAEQNMLSLAATLLCIIIYGIMLCFPGRKTVQTKKWHVILIALLFIEMTANSLYQVYHHYNTTYYVDQMSAATEYAKEKLSLDDTLNHVAMLAPLNDNMGLVHRLKTPLLFSTSLTASQIRYGEYLGCFASENNLDSRNSQTPLGYAVGNTQYLLLNTQSRSCNIQDTKNYTPIALKDFAIIFENERLFPFGYYLPDSMASLMNVDLSSNQMWSVLGIQFCESSDPIVYNKNLKLHEANTSGNASQLPAINLEKDSVTAFPDTTNVGKYNFIINTTAPKTGSVYVKLSDHQYLGDYSEGEEIQFTVDGRSVNYTENSINEIRLLTINNDMVTELCENVNKHPFKVESFTDDSLSGTIDLPEDGYINFTMPYDERWHILLDGEEVDAQSFGNAFLTLYAEKGHHEVQMEYIDNRRLPALLVTVFFWFAFLTCCCISDRKKKKETL